MNRTRELATLILIANVTQKLGINLTKTVNNFRRSLRKTLNKIEKHEKKLYDEAMELATESWDIAFHSREKNLPNLSVAATLDSLYLMIQDVKWIKKTFTYNQIMMVYASILGDKDDELSVEVEIASKEFTDVLRESLGFEKKDKLKLMIQKIKEK